MIDPANPDFTNTPVSAQRQRCDYAPAAAQAAPVVTIVTPFFNTGAIFHETGQSLMQQSLQQWEWLIVNDGSTDAEALAVLATYRQRDPRLRVIDLPSNAGSSAARNIGVTAARAALIAHLDSDDLMEPTTIEKWMWFLTSYPEYGAVGSHIVHFGAKQWLRNTSFEVGRAILQDNLLGMRSMVRRAVHQAAGGFNEENRQGLIDWEYWLRIAHAGYWGGSVPELLPWYRRRLHQGQTWPNWRPEGRKLLEQRMRRDYASLWQDGGFPQVQQAAHLPYASAPSELPCANLLRKARPRLLVICDGAILAEAIGAAQADYDVTVASTAAADGSWLAAVSRHTPDVFVLPNIVRLLDQPRLLRYLIASRQADAVVLDGSLMGHLLIPYLHAHFPALPLVAVRRAAAEDDALSRLAVVYRPLNLAVAAEKHVKQWAAEGAGKTDEIVVQYAHLADIISEAGAQRAHTRQPAFSVDTGQLCATQAVEYMRLAALLRERPTAVSARRVLRARGPARS